MEREGEFLANPDLFPQPNANCSEEFCEWIFSRRGFMAGTGAILGTAAIHDLAMPVLAEDVSPLPSIKKQFVQLTINGESKQFDLDPRTSLLDLLREQLHSPVPRKVATTASAVRARFCLTTAG